jgi:hypothetical protein
MRWICFLLLFANIGYGLWSAVYVHAQPHSEKSLTAVAHAGSSSGGAPLVLLDEIVNNDPVQVAQDFNTAQFADSEFEVPSLKVEPSTPINEPVFLSASKAPLASATKPELAPEPEPIDTLNNKHLMCWAAGPVLQPTDADHLAKRALALGDQVKTKTLNVKTGEEFWVYLEPLVSHKAALTKLRELQAKKIDSFIVTRGKYKNAISLGLFSKAESAEQHQANMKSKGLDPKIEVRDRTRREFWVQFHLNQPLEGGTKQRLQGELDDPLEWQPVRCETELAADL